MKIVSRILKHAAPMMAAQAIPLSASFVIISVALALGRTDFVAVIGTTATIAGLGVLINVGVGIGTLRDLAIAGSNPHRLGSAITKNLRIASSVSFLVFTISGLAALLMWLALPPDSLSRAGIWVAFALQIPVYIIAPHTSVLSSAFQHLDRETENLGITLTRSAVGLGMGILVIVLAPDPIWAIALQSTVASTMAVAMLHERTRRLTRSNVHVKVFPAPDFSLAPIWERVMNSLDGAVFMTLFMIAQLVAATISIETASEVAAGVAFCRMVILPLKMVGLTAGRMNLRDNDSGWKFARGSMIVTGVFVVPIAFGLLFAAAFRFSPFDNTVLTILIAAQLMCEPFSGSLFAYLKVSFGARAGLLGLIITYLALAPALLVACRLAAPSTEALWTCLLIVRVCFSATTLFSLRKEIRSSFSPDPAR